jgi:AraC-like DNA-binding protein
MVPKAHPLVADRVVERRRAVALARHYREAEGLPIGQIADRLGRSPATIKAYFYDPTGEKARAVKARYQGVCRGCGAYTQPRNGKGDAYAYCKTCHPGAINRRWTRQLVLDAIREWSARFGRLPSSYDWSRTHARRRGGEALARLGEGDWPSASVVTAPTGVGRRRERRHCISTCRLMAVASRAENYGLARFRIGRAVPVTHERRWKQRAKIHRIAGMAIRRATADIRRSDETSPPESHAGGRR